MPTRILAMMSLVAFGALPAQQVGASGSTASQPKQDVRFDVLKVLQERGLLEKVSDPRLQKRVQQSVVSVYCGVDPTADSLHVGHLMPIITMRWWQLAGHRPFWVMGGATARIGDPGGRTQERPQVSLASIEPNHQGLSAQLRRLMPDVEGLQPIRILNNQDWLGKMGLMEFLREVGRFVPVESMLSKENVRSRLQAGRDINYAELSYQVLQAYDYLCLNRQHNVEVQLGGKDQWSNILAGIELVHTLEGERVFGVEFPWLHTPGKTDREPVWLSSKKTPAVELFRTLLQVPDRDVVLLLKQLTFLPLDQIAQMAESMAEPDYAPGTLQKVLATEVVRFVHGKDGVEHALQGVSEGSNALK